MAGADSAGSVLSRLRPSLPRCGAARSGPGHRSNALLQSDHPNHCQSSAGPGESRVTPSWGQAQSARIVREGRPAVARSVDRLTKTLVRLARPTGPARITTRTPVSRRASRRGGRSWRSSSSRFLTELSQFQPANFAQIRCPAEFLPLEDRSLDDGVHITGPRPDC